MGLGFSDLVYAEATVSISQFDILMEILIVNQTADTLQQLSAEFVTVGDLKLTDRLSPITMAPHSFHTFSANIKVSRVFQHAPNLSPHRDSIHM